MDISFRFPKMLVFIVLSSLMMHLGLLKKPNEDQMGKQPPSVPESNKEESEQDVEGKKGDTDEKSSALPTSKGIILSSKSTRLDGNKEESEQDVEGKKGNTDEKSTALPTSTQTITTVTILSSKSTRLDDHRYTGTGKIYLTLAVALILVAFCVGAAVMAVILCCTQEKWRRHISSECALHASKSPAERSDHVIVRSGIHVQTSDSVYVDPGGNENLSANTVPVNRGDEHLELRVPWEPNDYETVFEHNNRRSILEHPYGCVFAGSDVNPIAHNQMEHNEAINIEGEHGYFVLSLNEADGKNPTEGSEMNMIDAIHEYFVLASVEGDGENLTEGNKIAKGEKNHDYFVLKSHERDGEMSLKKVN